MDPISPIKHNILKRTRSLTTLDSIIDQVAGCDSKKKRTKKAKKTKVATRKALKLANKTASTFPASTVCDGIDVNADSNDLSTSSDEMTEASQVESFIFTSSVTQPSAADLPSSDNVMTTSVKACFAALVTPLSDSVAVLRNQVQQLLQLTQQLSSQITLLTSHTQQPTPLAKPNQTSQPVINQPIPSTHGAPSYSTAAASTQHAQGQVRHTTREAHRDAVAAMYVDLDKKQRRTSNIVISGLAANNSTEEDGKAVIELLRSEYEWDVSEWPGVNVVKVRRLGNKQTNKLQPLLVTLDSPRQAQYFINNAKWLRTSSNEYVHDNVFINADMTPSEAKAAYELRSQRRERAMRDEVRNSNQLPSRTGPDETSQKGTQTASRSGRTIYRSHGTSAAAAVAGTSVDNVQPRNEKNSNLAVEQPITLQWRQPATSALSPNVISLTGVEHETMATTVTPGHNVQASSFLPSSSKQSSDGSSQENTEVPAAAGRPSSASQGSA